MTYKNVLTKTLSSLTLLSMLLLTAGPSFAQENAAAPPNQEALVDIKDSTITFTYDGRLLFRGTIRFDGSVLDRQVKIYEDGRKIQQVALLTTHSSNKKIRISGTVYGSAESFPCEADRPTDRASQGPLIVRNASGIGRNLRNRAVYDRTFDWAFSVDANPRVVLSPLKLGERQNSFSIDIEGYEIVLRFRPRFYQAHRGLQYFEPWTYKVWPKSVVGWISWFAFFDRVTEKDMMETADVFSSTLRPYGYEYFQMDDGYQRGNGGPEHWLKPNEKFPRGLKYLAGYIKDKGLTPGLWMGVGIFEESLALQHPDWFVRDAQGKPVTGNWIQYPLDASNSQALDSIVRPIFRGFREQGWEYFKVDGLRHLRYEGYNAHRDYFDRRKLSLVDAFRTYVKTVRGAIGRDHFMLGCWGIRPELVGIIDGCRIGDDGFSYAGLAQYNSFNNIVWRNDPDHIELNEDAYRSTMVTSLTGSLMMLTDKPAIYKTSVIEPARRTAPVLFTLPGQLYDVDPSRSDMLSRVDAEVTGSGPRPFDAGYVPQCHLYSLELHREFGSWIVLGRTGGEFPTIRFNHLGIPGDREYLVFEFWSKTLKGIFVDGFDPGPIDPKYNCQLFSIRPRENRPQLLATNRHVSCGGLEVRSLSWSETVLSGTSELVAGDSYVIYIFEPAEFSFKKAECAGAQVVSSVKRGLVREVTLRSSAPALVSWRVLY
ncbi:MAG TPA: hypothetical protein DEP53_15640 [Bacteroidetes bacterium]|nr:hypothetical protein [Bacteroidota bacterium]